MEQPIETAPSDVAVLVFVPAWPDAETFGHVPASWWRAIQLDGRWFFADWGVMRGFLGAGAPDPTHWMPLPGSNISHA